MTTVDAPAPRFLFLHGWENFRPPEHWQHIAVAELRTRGYRVEYPQLPDANHPTVDAWTGAVDAALTRLATSHPGAATHDDAHNATNSGDADIVVVCHSLSAALWLAVRPGSTPVSRTLLVAPPAPEVLQSYPPVAAFGVLLAERLGASAAAGEPAPWAKDCITIVGSDDDPFQPAGPDATFGTALGLTCVVIAGGGHLDVTAGYGSWPSIVQWCLDPGASVTAPML